MGLHLIYRWIQWEFIWLFASPWTAAHQASLSFISQNLFKLMSIESVMPSNHLILCYPLLVHFVFPNIRAFSNEPALWIRWLQYRSFSFSISPSMNIQDWFPLGWICWIYLQSKGLSRVFSNTTVQSQFFGAQPSLWSSSQHPYVTTGKTIALTRQTFHGKVMPLLFKMLIRFVIAFLPRSKRL